MFEWVQDPRDKDFIDSRAFSNLSVFSDLEHDRHTGFNTIKFFDLPTAPPTDLGVFRELQFRNRPPFYIGSPDADDLNPVLDRYFFTGVPENGWTPFNPDSLNPIPNPNLKVINPNSLNDATALELLRDSNAAESLLVQSAFNINSTSTQAWLAVLKNSLTVNVRNTTTDLENVFIPHPYDSEELPFPADIDNRTFSCLDPRPAGDDYFFYRKQFRTFELATLEALAQAIVDEIRANNSSQPFLSISDLANSGVLQRAIDSTNINDSVPSLAPIYLDQARLIGRLSPFIMSRGDTFVVRAYGEVTDPNNPNRVISVARCEAVVQRFPEAINGTTDQRGFNIISFRWIDDESI